MVALSLVVMKRVLSFSIGNNTQRATAVPTGRKSVKSLFFFLFFVSGGCLINRLSFMIRCGRVRNSIGPPDYSLFGIEKKGVFQSNSPEAE